jgi:hypothetical protein
MVVKLFVSVLLMNKRGNQIVVLDQKLVLWHFSSIHVYDLLCIIVCASKSFSESV